MADDGAEMLPTLSSKIAAGQPLTAGETLRLTERSASVLNEYRKLCCDDEAFGEAAREEARRRYVAAFALITARSTGSFEHRAEAARKAVLGDGAPPSPTPGFSGAALLFVCGLVGGLLNSWMAVGPDILSFLVMSAVLGQNADFSIKASVQAAGHISAFSAVIQFQRETVPLHLWVTVLPGLWFGAVLGMHLTSILGALECSLPPAKVPTCEPEPAPELEPVPEPEPQPVPDPELKLVVESAPKDSCTVPIFWPPGPPVETKGERKVWNIVFLLLLVASFLPGVLGGLSGSIEWEEMRAAWYMPLVGVCGCTLASSTPVGGAIFFIPVLTAIDIPARQAVAFGVATQMVGMGLFATLRMSRLKLHKGAPGKGADGRPLPRRYSCRDGELTTQLRFTIWVVLGGWIGAVAGFFVLETDRDLPIRFIFGALESFFLYYVLRLYSDEMAPLKDKNGQQPSFLSHRSQWISACNTGHDGCTAWQKARGDARLLVLLIVLLAFDLGRTFLWFDQQAKLAGGEEECGFGSMQS